MGNTNITIAVCILLVIAADGRTKSADEKIVDAMNGLGINLYLDLMNEKENVLCSPLSVTAILNALLTGANDDVAAEIRDVLGYTKLELSTQQAQSALHALLSKLEGNRAGFVFGNSIWIQTGLSSEYGSKIDTKLNEDLHVHIEEHEVDFGNPISARGQIDNWIGNLSNNQMLRISSSEMDSTMNRLLASVVDFSSGTWQYQFQTSKTKREPFYIQGQKVVYVPMMLMSGYFKYVDNVDLNSELIEIPYADQDTSMVIILPKEIDGIVTQKELLSLDTVTQAIQEMEEIQVHLRIPRFELQSSLSLKRTLNSLGMVNYFASEQDPSVTEVIQKTVISVSEKGSLPDPLFIISNGMASNGYDHPRMTYYTVDHPFTFLIRHKPTGGILFIGQVLKP